MIKIVIFLSNSIKIQNIFLEVLFSIIIFKKRKEEAMKNR